MDTDKLLDLVKRYHENRDFITNEESSKMALIVPFIRHLGYDPNSPREVRFEFRAEFTHGDGKKHADRMDYAIFDKSGTKPLMVIEAKPLGSDIDARSPQLARYIAQMPDLHFGIITDGCKYLFFGDLESPNQMDEEPFFNFALDDPNADWPKVAKFLSKFSREAFNAETLVTDAENSRYRQSMIEKIVAVLRAPAEDGGFMKWLTKEVYKGHRTTAVMNRLGEVAKEAIEPALLRVMSDDFLNKLKERIHRLQDTGDEEKATAPSVDEVEAGEAQPNTGKAQKTATTEEELMFYQTVRNICSKEGIPADEILHKDTIHYFNVSYLKPTKWFLRFFGNWKRKYVVTLVPTDEARQLAQGFEVEDAPSVFGVSRIYIGNVTQMWDLKELVKRSLELLKGGQGQSSDVGRPEVGEGG